MFVGLQTPSDGLLLEKGLYNVILKKMVYTSNDAVACVTIYLGTFSFQIIE
ncbi:hypothetical protein VCRA2113O213_360046 [Vibrio crassostreae]|nr:hypothetical protein VCRA2113O213_360046 [Vibrio crassostreae]